MPFGTRTIASVVVHPLCVEDIVHGDHVVVLAQRTAAHATELLHVASDAEQETEVDAERPDVGARLARHPEHSEVALLVEFQELGLVDRTHTELTLDGRDERGALEEGTSQGLDRAGKGGRVWQSRVQTKNGNVLLSCERMAVSGPLLRGRTTLCLPAPCWDFTSRVARSMQTIKHPVTLGSRVPLCPVFSTRRIRLSQATTSCEEGLDGLSKLMTPDLEHVRNQRVPVHEEQLLDVRSDVPLQRAASGRYGREMARPDQQLVIVLEKKRPLRGVELGLAFLRLDGKVARELRRGNLFPCESLSGGHDCEQQAASPSQPRPTPIFQSEALAPVGVC